jgi:hypothetical protein
MGEMGKIGKMGGDGEDREDGGEKNGNCQTRPYFLKNTLLSKFTLFF